jgi:hypothetical protein
MEKLLCRYVDECSRICNQRGYVGLSRELPSIKERLSSGGNGDEDLLELYNRELISYCGELFKKGVRIFGWSDLEERILIERLKQISNPLLQA